MGFIEFNKDTGLLVKTKVNIAQDLKTMFKSAYGQDFEIVEGTELYSLIDSLSSQLAETGSAAKAIYDGYSFTSATGTTLDVMCSTAGIYRKDGESDNSLRARYYTFLYRNSVGTTDALKARLLEHTYTDNDGLIQNSVEEVLIKNNNTSSAMTLIDKDDLKAHSIAVICKLTSSDIQTQVLQELSNIVSNHVSLGCGILQQDIQQDKYNILIAEPVTYSFDVEINANNLTADEKNAIKTLYDSKLRNYFNNLRINEGISISIFHKCLFETVQELGLSYQNNITLSTCKYREVSGGSTQTQLSFIAIAPNQFAQLQNLNISFSS